MIKSAREAKAIIEEGKTALRPMTPQLEYAHGYLSCLKEGEEVKALVRALEEIGGSVDYYEEPREAMFIAETVLSKYREAIGEKQ